MTYRRELKSQHSFFYEKLVITVRARHLLYKFIFVACSSQHYLRQKSQTSQIQYVTGVTGHISVKILVGVNTIIKSLINNQEYLKFM